MQIFVFRRLEGDDLRQTLVTIGISIVAADLMLATWGGGAYQVTPPDELSGAVTLPIVTGFTSSGAAASCAIRYIDWSYWASRPRLA